ncbi:MAG TPA: hypothetical protein VGJ01_00775, partial [Pseudolabrys sp.]
LRFARDRGGVLGARPHQSRLIGNGRPTFGCQRVADLKSDFTLNPTSAATRSAQQSFIDSSQLVQALQTEAGQKKARPNNVRLGSFQSPLAELSSLESVEHKKELPEQLFLLLSTRTPLTFVVHILPGYRVVIRPALPAISSISG